MRRFRNGVLAGVVGVAASASGTLLVGCSSSTEEAGPPPEQVQATTKQKMEEMQKGMMNSMQNKEKK